ncbi:MAG: hypothetical protein H6672_13930 [Anaerolineaceae bacterium]|nr:hypothetical protein [Anaerolineaceae bacterium]
MSWQGANFTMGSSEACLQVLRKTGIQPTDIPDEEVTNMFKLFIGNHPGKSPTKILAASGDIFDDLPILPSLEEE